MKKIKTKYEKYILQILANERVVNMQLVEISIEEAYKRCKKGTKVLVAEQDLEKEDCNVVFIAKERKEYDELFSNIQTAASLSDDLVEQLRLFTERQDILNVRPHGIQKIVLIKS